MKRTLALLLVIITVFSLFSCGKKEDGEKLSGDAFSSDEIVMKSANFSFTRGELSVMFYNYCNEKFSSPEAIDHYNVDPSVSLKEQIYYDDITWFNYFMDYAKADMKELLLLCEAAKAEGLVLSEKDIELVEKAVDEDVQYAIDMAYEKEEYFKLRYGPDGSENALREYLKKTALAALYTDKMIKSYDISDEKLAKYAADNADLFNTISYMTYTFDEDKDENAKAAAEALAAITDPAQFDSYVIDYMTNTLQLREEEIKTDSCYKNQKSYDKYSDFSKLAFDEKAPVGTTYIKENAVDGEYTVYLLTKAVGVRDDYTKNIRVILIDINQHETAAMAKSFADNLLEEWKAGEATEESFIQMVKDNTDEEAAVEAEGLLEGITCGDQLPDGMEVWLYNRNISTGDTRVFLDSGAYYVVYFCSDGELSWKMFAKNAIIDDSYIADVEKMEKDHTIETFDDVISSLNA
ncbi:MAG: hypothetical protein IKL24_02035 [Clostridia bacterium]|nr:hypothetical protein [Clostridia bacterium]